MHHRHEFLDPMGFRAELSISAGGGEKVMPEISRSSRASLCSSPLSSDLPSLQTYPLSDLHFPGQLNVCNMADALKAEGNKAFSAKDYATAMYSTPLQRYKLQLIRPARNSPRPSTSSRATTSSTPTAQLSTPRSPSTRKPSTMPTRLRSSSRTGRRAGLARELPPVVWAICVSKTRGF